MCVCVCAHVCVQDRNNIFLKTREIKCKNEERLKLKETAWKSWSQHYNTLLILSLTCVLLWWFLWMDQVDGFLTCCRSCFRCLVSSTFLWTRVLTKTARSTTPPGQLLVSAFDKHVYMELLSSSHLTTLSSRSEGGVWCDRCNQLLNCLSKVYVFVWLLLCSFGRIWVGKSRLFLFWVVNQNHPLCCMGIPQGSVLGPLLFILYTQPQSDIVEHHSVLHHVVVQFKSLLQHWLFSATCKTVLVLKRSGPSTSIFNWTEIRLKHCSSTFPHILRFSQSSVCFCNSARNLGVMFDSGLSMKQEVGRICKSHPLRSGGLGQFISSLLPMSQQLLRGLFYSLI